MLFYSQGASLSPRPQFASLNLILYTRLLKMTEIYLFVVRIFDVSWTCDAVVILRILAALNNEFSFGNF